MTQDTLRSQLSLLGASNSKEIWDLTISIYIHMYNCVGL